MNEVFPMYKLFHKMPQGNKKFTDWYPEVLEQARRCPLENYTPERAARDAITMQTSSSRLRKKALTDGPSFEELIKLGCTLESTDKQAAVMSHTESVRHIKKDKLKLPQKKIICDSCRYDKEKDHRKGLCPAKGKQCVICKKTGHFAQSKTRKNEKHVRSVIKTESPLENTSSDTESDDEIGHIIVGAVKNWRNQ